MQDWHCYSSDHKEAPIFKTHAEMMLHFCDEHGDVCHLRPEMVREYEQQLIGMLRLLL